MLLLTSYETPPLVFPSLSSKSYSLGSLSPLPQYSPHRRTLLEIYFVEPLLSEVGSPTPSPMSFQTSPPHQSFRPRGFYDSLVESTDPERKVARFAMLEKECELNWL